MHNEVTRISIRKQVEPAQQPLEIIIIIVTEYHASPIVGSLINLRKKLSSNAHSSLFIQDLLSKKVTKFKLIM